jgi:hypothetical protein
VPRGVGIFRHNYLPQNVSTDKQECKDELQCNIYSIFSKYILCDYVYLNSTDVNLFIIQIYCRIFNQSTDMHIWIYAGIAQLVYRLTTGWTTERSEFESRIFTSAYRPDRLWGPPNHLYHGYRGPFPVDKASGECN